MLSFAEFFLELHGHEPFPWQEMLADRVVVGGWPAAIDLPTASGKTAVIDVAVWALATGTPDLRQPRRVFFVVDRRIVVDEAFERARRIAERLQGAATTSSDPLHEAAARLLACGGEAPLQVAALRGGLYRDHAWARSPVQPLVCVSTVDQVGSRLLFRGYGLSGGDGNQFPIHAGLVGNDALIVLDEAHLSRPFEETLVSIARYRGWSEVENPAPWHVVRMSATLDPAVSDTFPNPTDRNRALDDERLRRRFDARKLARLASAPEERFSAKLAEEARELTTDERVRVIGIVVNRVATARDVFQILETDGDRVLLTGRSRPIDRDDLLRNLLPRMQAGRERTTDDARMFVVATQCIEVGADLDFDALVTEVAPLDSLRQRFGRLDRLGELDTTHAVIAARKESLAAKAVDAIYGSSLAATWRWLEDLLPPERGRTGEVDLGVAAQAEQLPAGDELRHLLPLRASAPVLLPAHVDRLAQTSPRPAVEPEPALFLHGPEAGPPDVQVVWRADLGDEESRWAAIVALAPPRTGEMLQLPPSTVRHWLSDRSWVASLADVEGIAEPEDTDVDHGRRILRWRGPTDESTGLIDPSEIRPGDTVVVPAHWGGLDLYGWNPGSADPVHDVAEAAVLAARGRPLLRLHSAVLGPWVPARAIGARIDDLIGFVEAGDDPRSPLEDLLGTVSAEAADEAIARLAALLLVGVRVEWPEVRRRMQLYPDGSGLVLVGNRAAGADADDLTDEDDASSFSRRVSLTEHTTGVAKRTRTFAQTSGIAGDLVDDLELAARLHDLGKADPRFQVLLWGGDVVAAEANVEPLAKSGMPGGNYSARRQARELAGYPSGYRHEAASVALALAWDQLLKTAHDPDLVLHVVAGHHGHARPFLPPVVDEPPVRVTVTFDGVVLETSSRHGLERINSGVADRFVRCTQRYGWWGLAFLESVLRLADHRQSEAEQSS